jgi:hypothetical protein
MQIGNNGMFRRPKRKPRQLSKNTAFTTGQNVVIETNSDSQSNGMSQSSRPLKRKRRSPIVEVVNNNIQSTDSQETNDISPATTTVDQIQIRRTNKNTRDQYNRNAKVIKDWFSERYPSLLSETDGALILPLQWMHLKEFFNDFINGNENQYLSYSTINGMKSAIIYLHSSRNVTMDEEVDRQLLQFVKGYKKTETDWRRENKISPQAGKRPMPFEGFQLLCTLAMKEASFGRENYHLYCTLTFPLGHRNISTGELKYSFLCWENDCCRVTLPGAKNNQDGSIEMRTALFANPLNPFICPILALAIEVLSRSFAISEELLDVFDGSFTATNYSNWLNKFLKKHELRFKPIVGDIKKIGTHSNKKGLESYLMSGSTAGSSTASVVLRVGGKLGEPHQRYMIQQQAGDEFCGRQAAGLNIHDVDFMILPPHFKSLDNTIWELIERVVPVHDKYPHSFRSMYPALVASAIYHADFLLQQLPPNHSIFNNVLFEEKLYDTWRDAVITGHGHCPHTNMRASGIPPHTPILQGLNQVSEKMQEMGRSIDNLSSRLETVEEAIRGLNGNETLQESSLRGTLISEFQRFQSSLLREVATCLSNSTYSAPPSSSIQSPAAVSTSSSFAQLNGNADLFQFPSGYVN